MTRHRPVLTVVAFLTMASVTALAVTTATKPAAPAPAPAPATTEPVNARPLSIANLRERLDAIEAKVDRAAATAFRPLVHCDPFPRDTDGPTERAAQVRLARAGARPVMWVYNGTCNGYAARVGGAGWLSDRAADWRRYGAEAGRRADALGGVPVILDVEPHGGQVPPINCWPEWSDAVQVRASIDLQRAFADGVRSVDADAEVWYYPTIVYRKADRQPAGDWWPAEQRRQVEKLTGHCMIGYALKWHVTPEGRVGRKWYDEAAEWVAEARRLNPGKPVLVALCPAFQTWDGGPHDNQPILTDDWRAMLDHLAALKVERVVVWSGNLKLDPIRANLDATAAPTAPR